MLGNLFAQPLSMSSLVYLLVWSPPPHIPHTSSPNQCLLFATHAHTIATCFAVVPRLYHLFLVLLSTPYLWVISFSEMYWWVSSWKNCQNRPVFGQVTGSSTAEALFDADRWTARALTASCTYDYNTSQLRQRRSTASLRAEIFVTIRCRDHLKSGLAT